MAFDERRVVLAVDPDPRIVAELRDAVAAHRTLGARDLSEAREVVMAEAIDLMILGPSFAAARSLDELESVSAADPNLSIVLAADIVTNRLLRTALRAGLDDVLDRPLSDADLSRVWRRSSNRPADPGRVIEFVVEPASVRIATEPDWAETDDQDGWDRPLPSGRPAEPRPPAGAGLPPPVGGSAVRGIGL